MPGPRNSKVLPKPTHALKDYIVNVKVHPNAITGADVLKAPRELRRAGQSSLNYILKATDEDQHEQYKLPDEATGHE